MKKLKKNKKIELEAFADRHKAIATTSAIELLSGLEKDKDLAQKLNHLMAGLLAFAVLIRDIEAKDN